MALAVGDALYFALSSEPPLWSAWFALALAIAVSFVASRGWYPWVCALLAALALGFSLAKLQEERVAAPILPRAFIAHLLAHIDAIEPRDGGVRLLLSDPRSGAFGSAPRRLRLAQRGDTDLQPGGWVSVTASLQPPPAPVEPGANDFGRSEFFQSVGGVGFSYGRARPVIAARPCLSSGHQDKRPTRFRLQMPAGHQDGAALRNSAGGIGRANK